MVPGVGKPKTELAPVVSAVEPWALGRGPKDVRKKQIIVVRLSVFLNMMKDLLGVNLLKIPAFAGMTLYFL